MYEGATARWGQGAGQIIGGAGQPHMSAPRRPHWCGVFLSLLESSRVVFAVDKCVFI